MGSLGWWFRMLGVFAVSVSVSNSISRVVVVIVDKLIHDKLNYSFIYHLS